MIKPNEKGSIYLTILVIGTGIGISLACADLWIAISFHPSTLSNFRSLLLPLLVTALLCFSGYLVVSFIFWRQKTIQMELLGSLAAFEVLLFLLLVCIRLYQGLFAVKMIPWILGAFLISLGFAAGVFHFLRLIFSHEKIKQRVLTILAALPFLLCQLLTFYWVHVFLKSKKQPTSLHLVLLCLAILLLTIIIVHRMTIRMRMQWIVILGVCVLMGPLVALLFAENQSSRNGNHQIKHILLITIDTLRADSATETQLMPNVRKLAADSMEWQNAFSTAPWTLPAVVSIMTGHTPLTHLSSRLNNKIPPTLPTLAESMHNAGYFTAAIGENPVLIKESLKRGFDQFEIFPKSAYDVSTGTKILSVLFPHSFQTKLSRDEMNRLISNWVEDNYNRDFFLWVHFLDPHCPYSPPLQFVPPAQRDRFTHLECREVNKIRAGIFSPSKQERLQIQELYRAEVRSVDEQVAKLLSQMKRLGIYEDSLIVLTSDHGEEFWEHGGFEHGHSLYNEVLKVPLIVKLPQSSRKGVVQSFITTEAIFPTILESAGVQHKDDCLPPALLSTVSPLEVSPSALIATSMLYYEPKTSLIWRDFKYILNKTTGAETLYDLRNDPGERNSLVPESPDELNAMREELKQIEKHAQEQRKKHRITFQQESLDKDLKERLEALGYLH